MNNPRRSIKFLTLPFVVCLLVSVSGCGEDEFVDVRSKVPVVPVTGKILVDGSPLVAPKLARVVLHADAATKEKLPADIPAPSAWTSADGSTFNIGTYDGGDGAPAGTYKVTIEGGTRSMMNGSFTGGLLNGKYKDPGTTEFSVTITGEEAEVDLGTFELSTK